MVLADARLQGSVSFVDYFTGATHHPGNATLALGPLTEFPLFRVVRKAQ